MFFRRRGPFVFDAWPRLARLENCPPRRTAPVEALGVLLGELPPWPNKRPGVEDTGGEEGSIERVLETTSLPGARRYKIQTTLSEEVGDSTAVVV